ncbi:MAG: caspase family protein [Elusimicrobia bacterium]|nr:caspase family protein [Elusimicrobiota bacterium]
MGKTMVALMAVLAAVPGRAGEDRGKPYGGGGYRPPPQPYVQPYAPPQPAYVSPPTYYQPTYSKPSIIQEPYQYRRHVDPGHWKPPPSDGGPEMPPVMVDFPDVYKAVVQAYLKEQSEKGSGEFLLKDDVSGHVFRLRVAGYSKDSIVQLSRDEAFACVQFESGSGEKLDLDFYVKKRDVGEWAVSKIYVHKVDGKARFVYNADHQPVSPESLASAAAAARSPGKAAASKVVPKPKQPAKLSAQISLREPSGNDALDGGETGKLNVTVFNAGPGPAYAVRLALTVDSKAQVRVPSSLELGDIKAGQTATGEVSIEAPEDVVSGKVKVTVEAREGNGFDAEPIVMELEARAFKAPRLEVAGVAVGPGKVVKAGEPTKVSVAVRNAGAGPAGGVAAFLSIGSQDIFMSGEPSASIGELKPGQTKTAEFEFFVNKRYKGQGALPISVNLSESRGKYGTEAASLNLALGKAPPATKVFAVKGKESLPEPEAAPAADDVDIPPKARTERDPQAYAVLIGIEKYRDLPAVEFASQDADIMQSYLTRAMGYDVRNVVVLQDDRATLTDMATFLGPWLEDRVTAGSKVFVYYAGHGAPNPRTGEGYLIPYDGNPNYVETKAFSVKQLYANLAKLPSKDVTVVLDACFSGAGGRSIIAKGARPLVTMTKAPSPGENMAVITAAGNDQISTFYPEARHGMLTYFLLKGLRGGADADGDKAVTTAELFDFVAPSVETEARKQHVEQTPTINPARGALGDKGSRVWVKLR